jgi:hypothetical protein
MPKLMNERDQAVARIKTALQRRSGKQWSVTVGRGTAWGWINIDAPPARRTWSHRLKANASPAQLPEDYEEYNRGTPGGHMSPAERAELGRLLHLDGNAHIQGVNVAPSDYREYIARAEDRPDHHVTMPAPTVPEPEGPIVPKEHPQSIARVGVQCPVCLAEYHNHDEPAEFERVIRAIGRSGNDRQAYLIELLTQTQNLIRRWSLGDFPPEVDQVLPLDQNISTAISQLRKG